MPKAKHRITHQTFEELMKDPRSPIYQDYMNLETAKINLETYVDRLYEYYFRLNDAEDKLQREELIFEMQRHDLEAQERAKKLPPKPITSQPIVRRGERKNLDQLKDYQIDLKKQIVSLQIEIKEIEVKIGTLENHQSQLENNLSERFDAAVSKMKMPGGVDPLNEYQVSLLKQQRVTLKDAEYVFHTDQERLTSTCGGENLAQLIRNILIEKQTAHFLKQLDLDEMQGKSFVQNNQSVFEETVLPVEDFRTWLGNYIELQNARLLSGEKRTQLASAEKELANVSRIIDAQDPNFQKTAQYKPETQTLAQQSATKTIETPEQAQDHTVGRRVK